ncbi:MAG: TonB-dependent receptor [Candidatus Desantisbacteria bacterium]
MKQPLIKLFFISSLILYSQPVFSQEPLELLLFNEDELVVTAAKREQKIIEAPCAIKVVTRGEIEAWGYRNLEELLRAQHEVDIANNRVFTIVSLRGCGGTSGSERILFLLDGRSLNDVVIGSVEPKMIGLDNVEQVEILQGPGSAMYGANAFGGVINIITRSADKPVIEVTSSIGMNKMLDRTKPSEEKTFGDSGYYRVCYGNNLSNNTSLFVTASQMDVDGDRSNADVNNDIITARFNIPVNDSSNLTFYTGMSDGNLGFPEFFWEKGKMAGRVGMKNRYSEVLYKGVVSPASDLSIHVYHVATDINFQMPVIRIYSQTSAKTSMEYPNYPESANGLEVQQNWLINEQNFLICGVDFRRQAGELPKYTTSTTTTTAMLPSGTQTVTIYGDSVNERYTGNTNALFIQDEFKPNSQLTLTMGARYDHHNDYGSMVSPRLGLVYNLKNHPTVFKLSTGKAFRSPDFSELYNQQYFLSTLVQKQPNKELVPEEITSYEAGIFHQFNEKMRGKMVVFKNDMKNLIALRYSTPVVVGAVSTFVRAEYANQALAETKGVELGLERSLTDNLFASLLWTQMDTRLVTTAGKDDMPYIPKNKLTLNLNYIPSDLLGMGLNGTMVGKRLSIISQVHPTRTILPDYFLLDAYLRWRLSDTVSMSVIGNNLLNENYEEGPAFMTTRRQTVQVRVRYEM